MNASQNALAELRAYCDVAVKHSYDQYSKHGTLHEKAHIAFHDESVWQRTWVPDEFDVTDARLHPVYQKSFSAHQKLAWNHFMWALDYSSIAQGERQLVVLNNYAVLHYGNTLPSVVELQRRESFEETDHISAFRVVIEGVRQRYSPSSAPIWSQPASGFGSEAANSVVRQAIGRLGNFVMGSNFPTLFFLARGMKTHGMKPFENAITRFEDSHPAIRMISHLHRLDESRHMATSLYLAQLSIAALDTMPKDHAFIFKQAVKAAFPPGRSAVYRLDYWRRVLDTADVYANIPKPEKDALHAHMSARIEANLQSLHVVQTHVTRQANKRIVEDCGLSPRMKRLFVEVMRADPAYAATVDAVVLPEVGEA